ncbi:MAG: DUF6597 domain-containing transcriptional factor [Saprospiraceae bacterium]
MFYQEYLPAPALADTIACFWKFVAPADLPEPVEHLAPPDGCVSLFLWRNDRFGMRHVGFVKPSVSLLKSTLLPDSVYVGIRFLPGAFSCFFTTPIESLPADAWLEEETPFHTLLEQLHPDFEDFAALEALLLAMKRQNPDPEVAKAVQRMLASEGQCKISDIIREAYISERQLQKRFRKEVGLSMKALARVLRLRIALVQMVLHEHNSLEVSFNNGYYDQAHFLHECQLFAQQGPAIIQAYLRSIQHGSIHW